MDKVYLLLRNNRETGPYTLEEIVQTGLKPNDLIWVEGKSCSWSNPSELEVLKPYVTQIDESTIKKEEEKRAAPQMLSPLPDTATPAVPQAAPPKYVYISLPANFVQKAPPVQELSPAENLEQKAEELKKRIQAYLPENKITETDHLTEPTYSGTLHNLEKEYTAWRQAQKKAKKKRFLKRIGITVLIVLLLSAGYVLAKEAITTKKNKKENLTVSNSLKTKKKDSSTVKEPESIPQEIAIAETPVPTGDDSTQKASDKPFTPARKKNYSSTPQQRITKIAVPSVTDLEKEGKTILPAPTELTTAVQAATNAAPQLKKKTLGQKISNLFKPKSKQGGEEPENLPESPATGSNISNWVTITYASSLNRATGIQDLDFTLNNHSSETIKNAAVEVRYYNAQNELLEKKVIHFTSVPPQKSVILTTPANRLAHHIYYRLLSAVN